MVHLLLDADNIDLDIKGPKGSNGLFYTVGSRHLAILTRLLK